MPQTNIKINDADKNGAEEALKVGHERRIPFERSADPFYSEENMERLKRAADEIETSGGTVHDLSELEEMSEDNHLNILTS